MIRYTTTDGIVFKAVTDDMIESISDKEAAIYAKELQKVKETRDVVNEIINPE